MNASSCRDCKGSGISGDRAGHTLPCPYCRPDAARAASAALAAKPERRCEQCGGELTWVVEITGRNPFGSGYDLLICEDCDAEVERQWSGF